jgi:hypothetical protein
MTRLIPDAQCPCGSVLIPSRVASGTVPRGAAYVCLKCARAYYWAGTPPRLAALSPLERRADEDDDDERPLMR